MLFLRFGDIEVCAEYFNSDHFPVFGYLDVSSTEVISESCEKPVQLSWQNASDAALESYSKLCQKICDSLLTKYESGGIDGVELYNGLVDGMNAGSAFQNTIRRRGRTVTTSHYGESGWGATSTRSTTGSRCNFYTEVNNDVRLQSRINYAWRNQGIVTNLDFYAAISNA